MRLQLLVSLGLATFLPVGMLVGQQESVPTVLARVIAQDDADDEVLEEAENEAEEDGIEFEDVDRFEEEAEHDDESEEDGEEADVSEEVEALLERLSENNGDPQLIQMLNSYLVMREHMPRDGVLIQIEEREKIGEARAAELEALERLEVVQGEIARAERRFPGVIHGGALPAIAPGQAVIPAITAPAAPSLLVERPLAFVLGGRLDEDDKKAVELARQYRVSDDEKEKEALRTKLRELTEATFEKRLEARVTQIEEMQAKLDKVKAEVEKRKVSADKIVDRRVADLLDDPDPYSWDFDAVNTGLAPSSAFSTSPQTVRGFRPAAPVPPPAPGR